jgi:hypothetical protein
MPDRERDVDPPLFSMPCFNDEYRLDAGRPAELGSSGPARLLFITERLRANRADAGVFGPAPTTGEIADFRRGAVAA